MKPPPPLPVITDQSLSTDNYFYLPTFSILTLAPGHLDKTQLLHFPTGLISNNLLAEVLNCTGSGGER